MRKFLNKYSEDEVSDILVKIADILDRLEEEDLANFIDELTLGIKGDEVSKYASIETPDETGYIEVEVPPDEEEEIFNALQDLKESLNYIGK